MRKALNDIFAATRERGCAIIHISRLAGEEPFIATKNPCLGNASAPLIDITTDDYLAIVAEVRRFLSVEHDESLSVQIFAAGARDINAAHERLRSFADIQNYWKMRLDLVRTFTGRYAATEEDVYDLCYLFDRTTQLAAFDIAAFALGRGLLPAGYGFSRI